MKLKLKYIILALALSVAGCAAYFSVWGLSQLFAGASTAVIIMASVLETGKIVTTTALHTYWDKLSKTLRIYLTISVVILMVITSAGIYGFLSNAYQSTANKLEVHESELGLLDTKKATFEKSVSDNQKLIEAKTKRLEQLSNLRNNQELRLDNSVSNKARNSVRGDIKSADAEIQKLNTEIDLLNSKNFTLADSINAYSVKAIELKAGSSVAAEVGPLKYISQLTGVSMASVVNYMILLLIFVFDPLAVALVLITNRIFQIESEGEVEDSVKVLNNVSEEKIDVKIEHKPILHKNKYDTPLVSTIDYNDNVLEEPIEYSEDEIIEQPVFENILDPIDDIIVNEEIVEIEQPEEPLEVKQETFLTQQEEKNEEPQVLDVVTNQILEDEITYVEEEVATIEEEIAQVEQEVATIEEESYLPKGKIMLEDIKEVKERNRGFSVNVPEPKRNNFIQRLNKRK
jgi:molybdopterin-binding protein